MTPVADNPDVVVTGRTPTRPRYRFVQPPRPLRPPYTDRAMKTLTPLMRSTRDKTTAALLQHIEASGPTSRSQLREVTGLSPVTVSRLTAMMVDSGLLAEVDPASLAAVGTRRAVGRPERPLGFRPAGRILLGTHIHGELTTVTAYDLSGDVLHSAEEWHGDRTPGGIVQTAADLTAGVIKQVGVDHPDGVVVGVGVSVGGVVDVETGRVVESPHLGWHDVDLGSPFESLRVPVLIDSSVRAAAVRQLWDPTDPVGDNTLTVMVAGEVGSAIVIDRALHRGPGSLAGEIAHLPVRSGPGTPCPCGQIDCLGVVVTNVALHEQSIAAGLMDPSVEWRAMVGQGYTDTPELAALRRRRGTWLGEAVATLIELLNPDSTTILGYIGTPEDVEHCLDVIRERAAGTLQGRPQAVRHQLLMQSEMWDRVSAALVIDDLLHRPTRYEPSLLA